MGLWDSASKSLPGGVALGVRVRENEEDRAERKTWREEQKKQWEAGNKRADAAEGRAQAEFDEKKEFKKVKSSFDAFHAMYKAGIENEDTNMQRSAAAGLASIYNSKLPNGDEVKIIFKSDAANNPELSEKWNSDEKLKDKDVAVLSKSGGIMPFKNLDDVFKFAASGLNMENFTAGIKQAEAKVAELNAREEPFMGNDGQYYTRRWKMGKGGMPEKSDPIPYTGVTKASKTKQDVVETEQVLGRKLKSGEVGVKAGLTKAEGASEAAKNYAQAEKARAEEKAAAAEGKTPRMKKADLDAAKASLDMLLRPFVSKGQPILDPETGEMTQAADNGLKVAGQLIDKYKEDPKSLTKEERRNLPHAVRAWEVYKSISASVTAGHISPEQAARMAEGEGTPSNYKDGNWHVVPSGEHKGKEARYNPETKKFQIRERGGASASFDDSGEPAAAPRSEETPPVASAGLTPPAPAPSTPPSPKPEPTAAQQNATRAGLVAGHIGANREKTALDNLTTEDLAEAGRAALAAITSPARRVMEDYDEQKRRSGR